jgi:ubiquinone/menaquinone biosynthesis C-methylase UbiE
VIADIGAGSGYVTFRIAHHVGQRGCVFAVDVNPEMILHLNCRIRDLATRNVTTLLCAPDDPLSPDGAIDRFFICDTWHHIPDQAHYLSLLNKMLKPGGQIVMIDFKTESTPAVGPPLAMRIGRNDLVLEMEQNGFRLQAEQTVLPYQYFLTFALR